MQRSGSGGRRAYRNHHKVAALSQQPTSTSSATSQTSDMTSPTSPTTSKTTFKTLSRSTRHSPPPPSQQLLMPGSPSATYHTSPGGDDAQHGKIWDDFTLEDNQDDDGDMLDVQQGEKELLLRLGGSAGKRGGEDNGGSIVLLRQPPGAAPSVTSTTTTITTTSSSSLTRANSHNNRRASDSQTLLMSSSSSQAATAAPGGAGTKGSSSAERQSQSSPVGSGCGSSVGGYGYRALQYSSSRPRPHSIGGVVPASSASLGEGGVLGVVYCSDSAPAPLCTTSTSRNNSSIGLQQQQQLSHPDGVGGTGGGQLEPVGIVTGVAGSGGHELQHAGTAATTGSGQGSIAHHTGAGPHLSRAFSQDQGSCVVAGCRSVLGGGTCGPSLTAGRTSNSTNRSSRNRPILRYSNSVPAVDYDVDCADTGVGTFTNARHLNPNNNGLTRESNILFTSSDTTDDNGGGGLVGSVPAPGNSARSRSTNSGLSQVNFHANSTSPGPISAATVGVQRQSSLPHFTISCSRQQHPNHHHNNQHHQQSEASNTKVHRWSCGAQFDSTGEVLLADPAQEDFNNPGGVGGGSGIIAEKRASYPGRNPTRDFAAGSRGILKHTGSGSASNQRQNNGFPPVNDDGSSHNNDSRDRQSLDCNLVSFTNNSTTASTTDTDSNIIVIAETTTSTPADYTRTHKSTSIGAAYGALPLTGLVSGSEFHATPPTTAIITATPTTPVVGGGPLQLQHLLPPDPFVDDPHEADKDDDDDEDNDSSCALAGTSSQRAPQNHAAAVAAIGNFRSPPSSAASSQTQLLQKSPPISSRHLLSVGYTNPAASVIKSAGSADGGEGGGSGGRGSGSGNNNNSTTSGTGASSGGTTTTPGSSSSTTTKPQRRVRVVEFVGMDDLESQKKDVDADLRRISGNKAGTGSARYNRPRMSLLGKPLNYRAHKRDARYRRLQARVYNFLERPKDWRAISYHLVV